jgi:hypothetical protein
MSTPLSPLLTLAEVDSYLEEGMCLIFQAEERLLQLRHDRACQGNLLLGAQILKAMRRTLRLIQERRNSLEKETLVLAVAPSVPVKRRWWAFWRSSPRSQPKSLEGGRPL